MRVQLAQKYNGWPRGTKEVIVEPKIDGWRMIASLRNGKVYFLSRTGKDIGSNLSFLSPQIKKILKNKNGSLDGEVVVEKWGQTALLRKKSLSKTEEEKIKQKLRYIVFDIISKNPQKERTKMVHSMVKGAKNVKPIDSYLAKSELAIVDMYKKFRKQGYEGAMIKLPDAPYRESRTSAWQKMKSVKNMDAKITGFFEGKGKYKGMLGGFHVSVGSTKFKIGTGFSDKERKEFWSKRKSMIGKHVEVKTAGKNDVSKTREPRFFRLRVDK